VERISEAFVWPVRDPEWLGKILIIGLINLIPIVGVINGIGWMLGSLDRLRAGEEKLAPANLSYLGRGVRVVVVELVYALAVVAIAMAVYLPALAITVQQNHGNANAGLIALAFLLTLVAFGLIALGSLALTFMLPALILAVDAGGIVAGLHVGDVLKRSRANPMNTLIAGLMLIAASFVSSLGGIACGVGAVFTGAYAFAMQAWIIRSFEVGSTTPRSG
jgi:hypothetical protein